MNVYDFDKTIYDGDSTLGFYLFSVQQKPYLIKYLPIQIYGFLAYVFGWHTKVAFKEKFYIFLRGIKDVDKLVEMFWQRKRHKIKKWYIDNRKDSDIIVSASPEFLLKPICEKLKITCVIASKVNKNTGMYEGENCYGEEKVIRFKRQFSDANINEFYSDSLSDQPFASLAAKRYIVNKCDIICWEEYKPSLIRKMKLALFTKQFIKFLIVGCINAINGIIFSYIYSILLNINISFILGYITSMTVSYFLNSIFVFKERVLILGYIKFCISYIPNFMIQNIFVLLFYNALKWNKLIVFIVAAIVGVPITFIIMKFFAFNKNLTRNNKNISK